MADSLYLSFWFPEFDVEDMMPRSLAVMGQFPFSAVQPGITYLSFHPVSWNEPTILEQRFKPGISPEDAVQTAADFLHDDYAYVFEAFWDLWTVGEDRQQWSLQPLPVKFLVHGTEFDDGVSEQEGHVLVDFGLDTTFLQEEIPMSADAEAHVRANVQKLVEFTGKAEKASAASARLLWSESDETLAQKLITRLQKVQ